MHMCHMLQVGSNGLEVSEMDSVMNAAEEQQMRSQDLYEEARSGVIQKASAMRDHTNTLFATIDKVG